MSHILLKQIRNGKSFPMVAKISDISYSNKASEDNIGTYINLNTIHEPTSILVEEDAERIYQLIEDKNYTAISIDELSIVAKAVG